MDEQTRVANAADWYLTGQLNFDKRLIGYRYRAMKPWLQGPNGLELGPAEGQMTRFLREDFERLTVVDGAKELLALIPDGPHLRKVHALFEDFQPDHQFNTIIMDHILEHVDHPVKLLRQVQPWLAPGGRLLVGVPNAHSLHRLAAVHMGLLQEPHALNQRDHAQGHRRVYDPDTFEADILAAGLRIEHLGGVFLKPLSNQQIETNWTEAMMDGFYELGNQFPRNTADLFAVCRLR